MKTIVSSFVLSLALCAAADAAAQTGSAVSASKADTVMLSEKADGDYIVRKFMVKSRSDADYSIRYQINLSTLNAALSGNSKELDELNAFVDGLVRDTSARVQSVVITGYASPDGPEAFNKALATRRANDFKTYVDRKYGFSKKYKVTVKSVAEDWEMCRALVARSAVPEREAALRIIDSGRTSEQKEAALKAMPATWEYMKEVILPPLRRVELTIDYGSGNVVEERIRVACPEPAPAPAPVRNCEPAPRKCECVVVEDVATGLIVEMPESESAYRRQVRAMRDDVANLDREARREARIADRVARQEEQAARKIARKEAKAVKKAEKAARKSARELRKL